MHTFFAFNCFLLNLLGMCISLSRNKRKREEFVSVDSSGRITVRDTLSLLLCMPSWQIEYYDDRSHFGSSLFVTVS